MLSLRTSFLVFAGIFVLIAGLATLGNFAQASGVRSEAWLSLTSKIVFIGLAVALAFAFVPLMVNVVFRAQSALGNEARLAPLFALRVTIIWVLWTLMGLGSIVGVAAAALSGAFGDLRGSLGGHGLAPSQGLLVAGIGMTIADLRHASTYDIGPDAGRYRTVSIFSPQEPRAFFAAATRISSNSMKRGAPRTSTCRSFRGRSMGRRCSGF